MPNYKVKLDLLKLQGAFVTDLQGKAAKKRCLCIPIEEASLFLGAKGCYLDLMAFESRNESYGQSHLLKQSLGKEALQKMTEEERRSMPIMGSLSPFVSNSSYTPSPPAGFNNSQMSAPSPDELPF